ncbi:MAG TPA: glutaredoxin family protein [Candidatus Nitrosotalea sp.]|nr:glutaredoxin family protein [Candidatus Nitrosotalea sp.]
MGVQLLTRRGCHLCEQALAALNQLGIAPEIIDVEGDAQLLQAYDLRLPVVLRDGLVVAEGRIDLSRLRQIEPSL